MLAFARLRDGLWSVALVLVAAASEAAAQPPQAGPMQSPLDDPPPIGDDSAPALLAYQQRLLDRYRGYVDMPLDVKAAYFEWEMWRYHRTAEHQVFNRAVLPDQAGPPAVAFPARDTSTWNGALLAALCAKYATTHDAQTLAHIAELVQGLRFFFQVTGQPGLMARTLTREGGFRVDGLDETYALPDGVRYFFLADPAKGGYNQLAAGYAALMMWAFQDLPPDIQRQAREDIAQMILHIIDHDYRATAANGKPTTHGDVRPLVGSMSLPFNSQVAYLIVALGYSFPMDDPAGRERVNEQFRRLRGKHHVYYEDPRLSLVPPQRIGGSPLVKGMNDRWHVTSAAYYGLLLELDHARRAGEPPNEKFLYQLGQTMVHSMEYLHDQKNSLCAFMWAGLLQQPGLFDTIVLRKENTVRSQVERGLVEGVEQLRRFPLDRFVFPGKGIKTEQVQWADRFTPDDFHWKCDPYLVVERHGPNTTTCYCAMDFLYAYWVLRQYRLDQHPALVRLNMPVLVRTPGLE